MHETEIKTSGMKAVVKALLVDRLKKAFSQFEGDILREFVHKSALGGILYRKFEKRTQCFTFMSIIARHNFDFFALHTFSG